MRRELLAILALAPLLSACGGAGGKVQSASAVTPVSSPPARVLKYRQPVRQPTPPPPQVQRLTGLEGVINATTSELTRQFGAARLDVWEGDARKLQFAGDACVLDVYLYPGAPGREPQATYIDARRASDGKDIDRPACIQALKK